MENMENIHQLILSLFLSLNKELFCLKRMKQGKFRKTVLSSCWSNSTFNKDQEFSYPNPNRERFELLIIFGKTFQADRTIVFVRITEIYG